MLHHNPSRTAISPKAFGAGQGGWSDDIASLDRRAFGVPTKAQLGSNLYKSGLVVDAVNVNV